MLPKPEGGGADSEAGSRSFRWSARATLGWTVVVGLVTVIGVALTAFGLVAIEFLRAPGSADTQSEDFVVRLLSETLTRHLAVLAVVQGVVSTAMVVLLTTRKRDLGRARMLALEPIGLGRLVFWVVVILLAIFLFTELPQWMIGISDREALGWLKSLRPVWLAVLLLVVIAPVSEEIVFRGFFYGGLAPSRIGPVGAILFTSLVWAAMHVQYAWPVMVQIFVYGVIFGVVRWRSGSLWPPLVAHGLINLFASIVAYWSGVMAV